MPVSICAPLIEVNMPHELEINLGLAMLNGGVSTCEAV